MQEHRSFEALTQHFAADFRSLNKSLEELGVLYRNLPVPENSKKTYTDAALKVKSAWYACLVNTNIDVLLIPEYLETRLSRNILIKKETEQYFRSVENFHLHTIHSPSAVYESVLFSEHAEPKSSFDLFSSQAPESAKCPEELSALFGLWPEQFAGMGPLETLLCSFLDWHLYNRCHFSGQRQCILWMNFQLWKLYGPVSFRFDTERFLFEQWNHEISDPLKALKEMLHYFSAQANQAVDELRDLYKRHIAFHTLKSRQKLVSAYLFDNGFRISAPSELMNRAGHTGRILLRKGFISFGDFASATEIAKQKDILEMLLESGVVECINEEGEISLYLNTSVSNRKHRLFRYQNTAVPVSGPDLDAFIGQSPVKAIVPIELHSLPEPSLAQVSVKRQKAFFG